MKGMGLFLEAAHLLLKAGANATFLIAGGDRDPRQHLMTHRLIQSYGFPPGTVHIVGDGGSGSGSSRSGPSGSGSSGVPQGACQCQLEYPGCQCHAGPAPLCITASRC